MIFLQIILWISILALLHSYVIYPLLLSVLASNKKPSDDVFDRSVPLPTITILMSLYNEQEVIEQKINSIYNSDYPPDRIRIFIGSDASTDDTDKILSGIQSNYTNLHFIRFTKRIGKANVINELVKYANDNKSFSTGRNEPDLFLMTDANVILEPNTIFELAKHFKRKDIGVVDAILQSKGTKAKGISYQEQGYVARESRIKYHEGLLWGTMVGPSGGCYLIKASLYTPVPSNYLVDDFYITMKVLDKGSKAINEPAAICKEDVSSHIMEEFRRKIRIGTGNFQNLKTFAHMLFPLFKPLSFSFFSHKVLRWLGPFFIIMLYLCTLILRGTNDFYSYLFIIEHLVIIGILIDLMLQIFNIQIKGARYITHFFLMNLALLMGFFKYLSGVRSNVWQPTKRNQ